MGVEYVFSVGPERMPRVQHCSTAARRDVRGEGKGFRGSTFSGTPVKKEGPKKRREGKDVYVMQGLSVSREPSWIGGG